MYVYTYIGIDACLCMRICVYTRVRIPLCMYVYTNMYIMRIIKCTGACIFFIYVCTCVYLYYVCAYLYISLSVNKMLRSILCIAFRIVINARTYIHGYINTCTYRNRTIHIHADMHVHTTIWVCVFYVSIVFTSGLQFISRFISCYKSIISRLNMHICKSTYKLLYKHL